MRDLPGLLAALDPYAPLAQRHLWLLQVLSWVRGDGRSAKAAAARVLLLVQAFEAQPDLQPGLKAWWRKLVRTVDVTTLLADFGFAPRHAFLSELLDRLRRKWLPGTPETVDASELFALALPDAHDADWLLLLDEPLLERLANLLHDPSVAPGAWQRALLDAVVYAASQIRATGFSSELRLRMSDAARESQPFHALAADVDRLCMQVNLHPHEPAAWVEAAAALTQQLAACAEAAETVYAHLDEHGISVDLVFRLRQLQLRRQRLEALIASLLSVHSLLAAVRMLAQLVEVGQRHNSVAALVAANTSLLAAKVAQRSAETGEHYITRNLAEYREMLRKAAGGGAFMSLTTWVKFGLLGLGLSAFWSGLFSGLNYALSFVAIQLLHWTVATKQPAMTAPAMAAKLKDLDQPGGLDAFVDEVTHLVRSQTAAVAGNLALVVPGVLLISAAVQAISGQPMIDAVQAEHVLHSLSILGPTTLFAALTGVLLFACSIIAGWVENWFVLHRLDSALRYNPNVTESLGIDRAAAWAGFLRDNISGFAANISLGLMLGLLPAAAAFVGLPLEVRHVTLSTGQIAAAAASLGWGIAALATFWWCIAGLAFTGLLNVGVSFFCALRLALRAQNTSHAQRVDIGRAIGVRWRQAPLSFFWPPAALPPGSPHG